MVLVAMGDEGLTGLGEEKVGVVEVIGPITDSKETVRNLRRFVEDDTIKAIVVRIDSPGGSVAPSQEMFQAVQRAKEKKPLVVSMGNLAASGGYYIAIGADKIYANPGSVTGSIGVITQLFNVSRITEKLDLEVNTLKTGPYKDSGSPFREFTVQDEVYFRDLIDDIYEQFVEDVAKSRKMEVSEAKKFADGRVFTGRQAKEYGLVDELGTLTDAVDYVAKEAKIEGDPKIVYPAKETSVLDQLLKSNLQSLVSEAKQQATPVVEYRYVGPQ